MTVIDLSPCCDKIGYDNLDTTSCCLIFSQLIYSQQCLGLTVLHAVVAYYFENPNVFSWILNNWDSLQENEEQLHAAAQKLNFHINL